VDDYLSEQEQWDEVKAWLKEGWPWFVGAALVIGGGFGAWKWWQGRAEERYVAAAGQYEQLVQAFSKNDVPGVLGAADKIVKDYPGTGYAEQSELAAARVQVENKQLPAALERLQRVLATTKDDELKLLVRARIARVQIQLGQPDAALATLDGNVEGAFGARFAELRGDALLAKGDREGALKAYREAQHSGLATPGAGDLLALKINDLTRS
jgi:predicted negative regulator of RcsB-dependent stress response